MANANRIRACLWAVGWTLTIFLACTVPGEEIPDLGFDLFRYDKLVHFTMFLGFGWLWIKALPGNLASRFAWVGLAGLAYGIITELYQGMLPWERTPDPMDALANLLGLLTAFLIHERTALKGWW